MKPQDQSKNHVAVVMVMMEVVVVVVVEAEGKTWCEPSERRVHLDSAFVSDRTINLLYLRELSFQPSSFCSHPFLALGLRPCRGPRFLTAALLSLGTQSINDPGHR